MQSNKEFLKMIEQVYIANVRSNSNVPDNGNPLTFKQFIYSLQNTRYEIVGSELPTINWSDKYLVFDDIEKVIRIVNDSNSINNNYRALDLDDDCDDDDDFSAWDFSLRKEIDDLNDDDAYTDDYDTDDFFGIDDYGDDYFDDNDDDYDDSF